MYLRIEEHVLRIREHHAVCTSQLDKCGRNMHGAISICIRYVWNGPPKPTGYSMYDNASYFLRIPEQREVISVYNINWLVFVTDRKCVSCAVQTESGNIT